MVCAHRKHSEEAQNTPWPACRLPLHTSQPGALSRIGDVARWTPEPAKYLPPCHCRAGPAPFARSTLTSAGTASTPLRHSYAGGRSPSRRIGIPDDNRDPRLYGPTGQWGPRLLSRLAVKSKGAEKPAKGRKGKAGKDPNKPKRAPSAFFVFIFSLLFLELRFDLFLDGCVCREEFRKEFKEKNPKNKSVAAVGKAAGDRWKSLSESDKAPYVAKANKLKLEYNKAIAAYNKGESTAAAKKAPAKEEEEEDEEESDKSKSEVNDEDDDEGSDEVYKFLS
ncbi:hypothetical protein SORBI_3010G275200 [Sorghum bicolor]|uniref:HMG box domain-containing protein n=1 Tax=Sorghum bicolor TaxID=4558 RepID=A0A194YLV3_SORBI|nr:hypothetical protein SORBI_3010G275200 [Sorghum bicolor]